MIICFRLGLGSLEVATYKYYLGMRLLLQLWKKTGHTHISFGQLNSIEAVYDFWNFCLIIFIER